MAIAIVVAGLSTIKVGTGSADALEDLGYTRDGVILRHDGYFAEVKCDDYGGEAGPGCDLQYMGETAQITLELTKWDATIAQKLLSRHKGGTAGTIPTAGTLMLAGNKYFRLLVSNTNLIRNYPYVIFRDPIELNAGTKFSTLRLEGTAWNVGGTLWNTTAS